MPSEGGRADRAPADDRVGDPPSGGGRGDGALVGDRVGGPLSEGGRAGRAPADDRAEVLLDESLAKDLAAAALTLARRFAAGATLWCVAPAWEPHAHHVAVEFVHPVIVGKRALPAVALTGPGLVDTARLAVRPGDVILAVAAESDPDVASITRRAPAWGATTLWIGNGPRPPAGAADHVLWLDDPDPLVPATGRFVLLYHLLWELTHVCFEHPGLLSGPDVECTDEVCITCGDEGRLAEVIAPLGAADGGTLVRTANGEESVDTLLVGPVEPGDLLLVHAGAAITRIHEDGTR
ncbi:HypC/HybG/HupF family hydrogenase formation chaperone [Thermopolyspora sp. NPDC052614]|uniref:HypC/HybG/HupF family hydrogenase formation chaperone n=1 Tax=Thermopolyspora sp. NPDC052614 TaxID=3155682 RepID=UPI0034430F10